MTRDKQIIIGGVVLLGLGFFVWQRQKADESVGKKVDIKGDLPELKADDPDKISITAADKGEVILEKKGEKWELSKPVAFPANQEVVKSVLSNLKELKSTEIISGQATDEQKKLYELDATKAVHVIAWKGADKKLDITFGKSGGRGQMAMVEGKPGVYSVSGYSSYMYTKEVKQWRDTEIFKFEDANVSQLQITNKEGEFSFTKGDKWGGTFKGKPIERFDAAKVDDAVRSVKALNADDFGDGKQPADTGLDAPEATMTVTLKDNAGKYTLKVGKVSSGMLHYAQKEGSPTVYIISNWPSEWATAPVSKFQFPADAGAKDGGKDTGAGAPMGMPPGMEGMPPGMMPHGMPPGHGH